MSKIYRKRLKLCMINLKNEYLSDFIVFFSCKNGVISFNL